MASSTLVSKHARGAGPYWPKSLGKMKRPKVIGWALRQRREAAGLSQEQLGKKAGVTGEYISRLEGGKKRSPSFQVLRLLAKALGVPVTELLE